MEPGLKTHVSDGTATVTISNLGKRNAMTVAMWRALRTGLVDEVLPEGELDKRVADFTAVLAGRSLLTQTAAKEFADGTWDVSPDEAEERGAYWAAQARESGDTVEGAAAFLERRAP